MEVAKNRESWDVSVLKLAKKRIQVNYVCIFYSVAGTFVKPESFMAVGKSVSYFYSFTLTRFESVINCYGLRRQGTSSDNTLTVE